MTPSATGTVVSPGHGTAVGSPNTRVTPRASSPAASRSDAVRSVIAAEGKPPSGL